MLPHTEIHNNHKAHLSMKSQMAKQIFRFLGFIFFFFFLSISTRGVSRVPIDRVTIFLGLLILISVSVDGYCRYFLYNQI